MSPGEVIEVATAMRKLGAAGFKYREFEVTFYEPLPLELQLKEQKQRVEGFAETDEEEEEPEKKLAKLRKEMADMDTFGAS